MADRNYGELVIFTRGEYRERLMANIHTLPNVEKMHLFGEEMPTDDDEAQPQISGAVAESISWRNHGTDQEAAQGLPAACDQPGRSHHHGDGRGVVGRREIQHRTRIINAAVDACCRGAGEPTHWRAVRRGEHPWTHWASLGLHRWTACAVMSTIEAIMDRRRDTGSPALKAEERQALRDLGDAYLGALPHLTNADLMRAEELVAVTIRRALAGSDKRIEVASPEEGPGERGRPSRSERAITWPRLSDAEVEQLIADRGQRMPPDELHAARGEVRHQQVSGHPDRTQAGQIGPNRPEPKRVKRPKVRVNLRIGLHARAKLHRLGGGAWLEKVIGRRRYDAH